jgi:hypothetical protein
LLNLENKVTKEHNSIRRATTPKARKTTKITMGSFTEAMGNKMRHMADNNDHPAVTEEEIDGQIVSLFKDKPIKFV